MADKRFVGRVEGADVHAYTLSGAGGLRLTLLDYGARVAELWVPDRSGALADVVLGQDGVADWQTHGTYLGATCGRYANRIAKGRFVLDGQEFQLDCNEGAQHLHGGTAGLNSVVWRVDSHSGAHVTFSATLADGHMGYPGTMQASVTYRLDDGLTIEMEATTDKPTIVNLVNHAYFNLAGHDAGNIMRPAVQIDAGFYLPVDTSLIPTGELRDVSGTAFDFRKPRLIGAMLPDEAGFDHNLCLTAPLGRDGLRPCLVARDPVSGRQMRLSTTEPGVQLYTGAHFAGTPGKGGARYPRFAGFAVETQRFPDSPNRPQFPSARLDPGQKYRHVMQFDFTPA